MFSSYKLAKSSIK
ncbi:hypothetical protein KTL49_001845 [Campylobacter jejuni]|nr:hypothetical protein [Campylobacter jejuni]EIM1089335.1 hypothetical protein [Campylobacter coli]EHK6268172.1 hypothetical protein [Campylobacter jejuni]EHN0154812.1 hypothetical protein [Campylobacter jejuni]EHO7089644.1 hypothetical protein [Campylobacter jejuni]